jgi:large subunit ribosomal protein L13
MKTSTIKPAAAKWYFVDAHGKTLGHLATQIAYVLSGKHKVIRSPHQLHSDHVIVTNAQKIVLQGKKAEQKEYIRHSGYFGNLKRIPFERAFAKDPSFVLLHAVRGMLPRNKLRQNMLKHLHIFADAEHTHAAQKSESLDVIRTSNKQKKSSAPVTNAPKDS